MPIRRLTFCFFALFGMLPAIAFAQSPPKAEAPPPTASVAGRVTLDGQPVAGARVFALPKSPVDKPLASASTDAAGRFRLGGLPDGTVTLWVARGADVFDSDSDAAIGKSVTLEPGEAVDDVELRLRPGGVITGRVTDAENRPVIGQTVALLELRRNPATGEDRAVRARGGSYNPDKFRTDDRGVYRLFGLPPGRYIVGIGNIKIESQTNFSLGGRAPLPGTFHPKTTDWKKAGIIELAAGKTEERRDIAVGRAERAFSVTGRVVDGETGAPVSKMPVSLMVEEAGGQTTSYIGASDAKGEFRLTNVKPGTYRIQSMSFDGQNDYINDPQPVVIENDDLKDLTIRLRHGVTISGRIELDGKPDTFRFDEQTINLEAVNIKPGEVPSVRSVTVTPDGSFVIQGATPNTSYGFSLSNRKAPNQNLAVMAVRRDGADLPSRVIEVGTDAITGLQVVTRLPTGRLRGEIRFVGGTPSTSNRYIIGLKPTDQAREFTRYTTADDRGRFLVEDLFAGTYTFVAGVMGKVRTELKLVAPPTVTIPENGEETVVLTVDLSNQSETTPQ